MIKNKEKLLQTYILLVSSVKTSKINSMKQRLVTFLHITGLFGAVGLTSWGIYQTKIAEDKFLKTKTK